MVKRLIIRFIFEQGSKVFNSVIKAYKETVKTAPKNQGDQKTEQEEGQKGGAFGKFSFNNLISSPMTKEEALKILNLKEPDSVPEKVMEQFEKYFEANDPMKGGSFYIQNKIYYAKEFLMEKHPKELNKSKFNPGSSFTGSSTSSGTSNKENPGDKEKVEDPLENNKNKNI
jgi:import inner membrane translocase subunit TIM16